MLALLAAFGGLDLAVLSRIRRLEATPVRTDLDLRTTQETIDRLARTVLVAGLGLGIAFLVAFVAILLRS
jgi:hypothetical protein